VPVPRETVTVLEIGRGVLGSTVSCVPSDERVSVAPRAVPPAESTTEELVTEEGISGSEKTARIVSLTDTEEASGVGSREVTVGAVWSTTMLKGVLVNERLPRFARARIS
jgi:hypothetical protein